MKQKFTYIVLLACMLLAPIGANARVIFLDYEWCNWGEAGARVYMWVWGGGNDGKWSTKFEPVPGATNLYYAQIPDEVTDCNVVREDPNSQEHNDHWTRTGNLSLPTGEYNTMKMWSGYQTGSEHYIRKTSVTFTIWNTDWATNYYAWYTSSRSLTSDWPGPTMGSSDCDCGYRTFTFNDIGADALFIINGNNEQTGNIPLAKYFTGGDYQANGNKSAELTPFTPVSSVSLNNNISLFVDDNKKITASITPNNATDKTIIWESSNTTVASVDADGTITAKATGSATITATAKYSKCKQATCTVTVYPKTAPSLEIAKGTNVQGEGTNENPWLLYNGKDFFFNATASTDIGTYDYFYLKHNVASPEHKTAAGTYSYKYIATDAVSNTAYTFTFAAYNEINGVKAETSKTLYYKVVADPVVTLKAFDAPVELGSTAVLKVDEITNMTDVSTNSNIFTYQVKTPGSSDWTTIAGPQATGTITYAMGTAGEYHFRVSMSYGGYEWTSDEITVTCKETVAASYKAIVGYPITLTPTVEGATAWTWTVEDESILYPLEKDYHACVLSPLKTGTTTVTVRATNGNTELLTKTIDVEVVDSATHILVRANIAAVEASARTWEDKVTVHYWGDKAKDNDPTFEGDVPAISEGNNWHYAVIPLDVNKQINLLFKRGGGTTYNHDQTDDITEQKVSACWIIQESGEGYKHMVTATNDGPLYYELASQIGEGEVFRSNKVKALGETVSFFATAESAIHLRRQISKDKWQVVSTAGLPAPTETYEASNVQVATFAKEGATGYLLYPGDYYINTDRAFGQGEGDWKHYQDMTEAERDSAQLTYFAPNEALFTDRYNYYWVEWYPKEGTDNVAADNARARIGNIYNQHITNTIVNDDRLATANATLPKAANVRYGYNPHTNTIYRAIIGGSADDGGQFLTLHAKESGELMKYGTETDLSTTSGTFADISNWCYEIDVTAKKGTGTNTSEVEAYVQAVYNGQTQYLFGTEPSKENPEEEVPICRNLLSSNSTMDECHMRVIYDFRTSRITAGWLIDEDVTIDKADQSLDANMMIIRKGNNDAPTITLGKDADKDYTLEHINQIYTVLEIDRDEWQAANDIGNIFYWISLPYDCYITDIFGIPGYGKNGKWVIQRYRGDMRAKHGWFIETPTFWANMNAVSGAKMEANRGYVVRLNLEESDFKNVEVDGDGEKVNKSILRLYFPSRNDTPFTLEKMALTTDVPEHNRAEVSTDKRRQTEDSNWNVIGVPGFNARTIDTWTLKDGTQPPHEVVEGENLYYYSWKWEDGKGKYTPQSSQDVTFLPTQAYMVQFAGTITWAETSAVPQMLMAPQQRTQKIDEVKIDFSNAAATTDHTYVQLTEGVTKMYDLNRDLGKIINEGLPQIYTLGEAAVMENGTQVGTEQARFAANNLPIESQSVALGIQAPAAGEYTFSMPNVPAGVTPTLYDTKENKTVNLMFDSYTVTLDAGTDETRFILQLNIQKTPTDDEKPTANDEWHITQIGNELLISGVDDNVGICLYDALGRQLYHTTNPYEMIPVPQTGVYLVQVNGQTKRILVK